jgi:hypothetical protein|tara:strand:- start:251 stop:631 length:381 start_codon:yes stop_codon:yes gene_type:complete
MALKTANFDSSVLQYKLVSEDSLSTPIVDVTQSSGSLYYIKLDAVTGISNDYYVKFCFTESEITVGTTSADMILYLKQATDLCVSIPGGIPFTKLSVWTVDGPKDSISARTTSGNSSTVKLTMVTS